MPSPLFIDIYALDVAKPDWSKVRADKAYAGAIIKATEGRYYTGGAWFQENWRRIREQHDYGNQWFRGAYHFLKFNEPGDKQADFYQTVIERAGGWERGDLWPIVDVELGGEKNSNRQATREQVIECTTKFAERMKALTSRDVCLYGNGAMRDLDIKDKMGCKWLWCPRYTTTLPTFIYERAGWTTKELFAWQYCGDGVGFLAGYPTTSPLGKTDISVLTMEGGLEGMKKNLGWKYRPVGPKPKVVVEKVMPPMAPPTNPVGQLQPKVCSE
jgi:GH25 family lysozyme M1 (1,4-beta-N-acetylmuramidase)